MAWRSEVSQKILVFAVGDSFSAREKYIYICDAILREEKLTEHILKLRFQHLLLGIVDDSTANVRVVLGRVLSRAPEWFKVARGYADAMRALKGTPIETWRCRLDYPKQNAAYYLAKRALERAKKVRSMSMRD